MFSVPLIYVVDEDHMSFGEHLLEGLILRKILLFCWFLLVEMLPHRFSVDFPLFAAAKMAVGGQLERYFIGVDVHISHQQHKILIIVLILL